MTITFNHPNSLTDLVFILLAYCMCTQSFQVLWRHSLYESWVHQNVEKPQQHLIVIPDTISV